MAPTSPIFTGDYEMQTDINLDTLGGRASTLKQSKKHIAKRDKVKKKGDMLEKDPQACMDGCNANCQIF
jgi:hypothetical protein